MEKYDINDEFADLFKMLNENEKEIKISEEKENIVLGHINICKTESKKMKKAKIKIDGKKVIPLVMGTVVIMSLSSLIKVSDEVISDNNSTIYTEYNSVQYDYVEDISSHSTSNVVANEEQIFFDEKEVSKNDIKLYDVGNNEGMYYVENYMDSDEYKYFQKYSEMYGVPVDIMLGIGMQETSLNHEACLPGGKSYNGCAVGIMQIENGCHTNVTAFNYEKNDYETLTISEDDKQDIETNIKIACMLFQQAIEKYKGNIYLAIQSHNFGSQMLDIAIERTAEEKNISEDEVIENFCELDWMNYVKDIHDNPHKYLSNWEYDTYGSAVYIDKVLSYCINNCINYKYNNKDITFDLSYGNIENNQIKGK